MTLDINTLHFASAASRSAYVVVFLVMALGQTRQTYLWHWMGAMAVSMAGSIVMMGIPPDTLPPVPIATVTYCLYGGSIVLSWTGLRTFFGRPVNVGLSVALVALTGLLFPASLALGLPDRMALAVVLACCLVLVVLAAYEAVRPTPGGERLWAQYLEFAAFALYAVVFILTIGILLGTDRPIANAESARTSMILDQITGVFVYFGYAAMAAERANRSLARLADTDPLTGLLNRRGLREALRRRLPVPGRRAPGGVLIADIDHFKAINDTYGHDAGDLVITAVAARMRVAFRATDIVARWGGEEFLVVLPGATPSELVAIAERLRASVAEQPFPVAAGALAVTISIGVAAMGPDDPALEDATRRADAALYDAKAGGRNRVVCGPPAAPARRASASLGEAQADLRPA